MDSEHAASADHPQRTLTAASESTGVLPSTVLCSAAESEHEDRAILQVISQCPLVAMMAYSNWCLQLMMMPSDATDGVT